MKYKTRVGVALFLVIFGLFVLQELQTVKSYTAFNLTFDTGNGINVNNRFETRPKQNESVYPTQPVHRDDDYVDQDLTVRGDKKKGYVNTDKDVDEMFRILTIYNNKIYNFTDLQKISFPKLVEAFHVKVPKGKYLPNMPAGKTNWETFWRGIHQTALYDPYETDIDGLLNDLSRDKIVFAKQFGGGTQVKILLEFENRGMAMFKPMRFPREVETNPDHFYFNDYERHHAEIAAFHLDRLLGFYRVPPTVGRLVNMSSEMKLVADRKFNKSFFYSPVNNLCFYSDCAYYCDTNHAICGTPDLKEGSIQLLFPSGKVSERFTWVNPWKRSYSKRQKAPWETDDKHCDEKVRDLFPYNTDRRLLELIDMHVFDFLGGNMDRHHYETFADLSNNSFYLHYDNGRAFGKTKHDEMSILAPLYQCCQISFDTFTKLAKLYIGPKHLSDLMRESLSRDPRSPILIEGYLEALDRRVMKILQEVNKCILKGTKIKDVIVDKKWRL